MQIWTQCSIFLSVYYVFTTKCPLPPLKRSCCKDLNNVCIFGGGGGEGVSTCQENPILEKLQHLYKIVCLACVDANERVFIINSILFLHAFHILSPYPLHIISPYPFRILSSYPFRRSVPYPNFNLTRFFLEIKYAYFVLPLGRQNFPLFFIPEPTARSAVRRGLLIPHGYLHPGKMRTQRSAKFINDRGRVTMVRRSWVVISLIS